MNNKRLTLRVKESTYNAIIELSMKDGRTMNNYTNRLLEKAILNELKTPLVKKNEKLRVYS